MKSIKKLFLCGLIFALPVCSYAMNKEKSDGNLRERLLKIGQMPEEEFKKLFEKDGGKQWKVLLKKYLEKSKNGAAVDTVFSYILETGEDMLMSPIVKNGKVEVGVSDKIERFLEQSTVALAHLNSCCGCITPYREVLMWVPNLCKYLVNQGASVDSKKIPVKNVSETKKNK